MFYKKKSEEDLKVSELGKQIEKHNNQISIHKKAIESLVRQISDIKLKDDLSDLKTTQQITIGSPYHLNIVKKELKVKRELYHEQIKEDYVDISPILRQCFIDYYKLDLEKFNAVIVDPVIKKEASKYVKIDIGKIKYSISQKKSYRKKRLDGIIEALKEDIELENKLRGC